jgi:beta-lactamase regulating signal transducer with metallopeptidase domain
MASEMMMQYAWLGPVVWQSTAALTAGLVGSHVLRRRPARAHQVLLLALMAAVAVPLLSHSVRQNQWGLFEAEPTIIVANAAPSFEETIAQPTPEPAVDTADEALPVPMQVTPTASRRGLTPDWARVAIGVWVAAGAALLLRLGFRFLLAFDITRRSEAVSGGRFDDVLRAARLRLRIKTDVIVRSDRRVCSPVIWCWGKRPVLLVPHGASDGDGLDWPSIVCHELAHWKRRDHVTGLLAEMTVCLLPWQPLLWLARQRLTSLSEEACDDWVIAAGQTTTRYARTLLDLTPLGQAALVPGVVTSRKGLAARVRRIVGDRCSNPRSGRPWTLAAVLSTATLATGIALAQTRPGGDPKTIKTVLPHGAVIEQLADATTIKGQVLDPNGEPIEANVVAMPVTSQTVSTDDEGNFELPWSATWVGEGQPICLMAWIWDDRDEAAIVEIEDPSQPVTIRLQRNPTLTGRVVDPNGRDIRSLTISLAKRFRCRAPLRGLHPHLDPPGRFTCTMLPYGQKYKLEIEAKGYQPTEVTIDATDMSIPVIDIGRIVVQPENQREPHTAGSTLDADLEKDFYRVYSLDEGEVLKLVKPPCMLGRHDYLLGSKPGFVCHSDAWVGFRWSDDLEFFGGWALGHPTLDKVLRLVFDIPRHDYRIPKELRWMRLPEGDWVVRATATPEERLCALREILHSETGRSIRFTKKTVERDTIVVTGRYAFTPLPGKDPERLSLFVYDRGYLYPYSHAADSLAEFWRFISARIGMPIEDSSEPVETGKILFQDDGVLHPSPVEPLESRHLRYLLDNLARQTNLQFTIQKRPTEIWFVTEAPVGN